MINKGLLVLLVLMAGVTVARAAEFDHRAHLKEYAADAPCSTCHVEGAASIRPDKAVCLSCHKQEEIAAVPLREPRTHGPGWGLNHQAEAKGSAIDCSACHEQRDCLECHKAGFADEMGVLGNNVNNVHRSDFHVTHPIAARNDQRLCSSCHEPRFCESCHEDFRVRRRSVESPSHRYVFDMGDGTNEPPAFHAGFKKSACDGCHQSIGDEPELHDWAIGHAREARRSLATCQTCHPEGDVCIRCHSARGSLAYNPHGDDWDDVKGNLRKAANGKTCRKCH
ncbi:MAG: cytochrome C [Deltaproteobacteria bacterium]|nr:MAG: cytochrome C [Deltaproteobacteria bacterium]